MIINWHRHEQRKHISRIWNVGTLKVWTRYIHFGPNNVAIPGIDLLPFPYSIAIIVYVQNERCSYMIGILKYVRNYIFNVHVWHFLVYLKISLLKINNVLWNHILLKAKHAKKNKHPKKRDVFLLLIAEYWPWTCEDDERDLILNFITEHSGFSELNRDNRWYLFRIWTIKIWHTKINVKWIWDVLFERKRQCDVCT